MHQLCGARNMNSLTISEPYVDSVGQFHTVFLLSRVVLDEIKIGTYLLVPVT